MKTNYRKSRTGASAVSVRKALKQVLEGPDRSRLFGVAYRLCGNVAEADELTQDACYRALKAGRNFDSSRPILPWVLRILRNSFFESCRRARNPSLNRSHLGMEGAFVHLLSDGSDSALERAIREERAAAVSEQLGSLRKIHREALVLLDLLGLTYSKAAKRLGVPVGTVRSRLSRAREVLRLQFAGAV